jgi:hypothetical protein
MFFLWQPRSVEMPLRQLPPDSFCPSFVFCSRSKGYPRLPVNEHVVCIAAARWLRKKKNWKRGGGRRHNSGIEGIKDSCQSDVSQYMLRICTAYTFDSNLHKYVSLPCLWTSFKGPLNLSHNVKKCKNTANTTKARNTAFPF